jgi:hypothetical protein
MRKSFFTFISLIFIVLLSSWGSKGHRKVSTEFVNALPSEMGFFQPEWTGFVTDHASDADYRKSLDPNESARHYIDIDDYPEFVENGFIMQHYDSIILIHGFPFVWEHGILPWATITTYDSLKGAFSRRDWNRSAFFAADLGHYVGDGHMPLHITRNYNGQYTGQSGIHSRYESSMISRYESELLFTPAPAEFIDDIPEFVFNYLYTNNKYVDSILIADLYARQVAGSTSGDSYYLALWNKSGNFTINLMSNASFTLASLIYTAWVEAGSPRLYPNAIDDPSSPEKPAILPAFPNPVSETVHFPVIIQTHPTLYTIEIYNLSGKLMETLVSASVTRGKQVLSFDTSAIPEGTYLAVMKSGLGFTSVKFTVVH